ncbi:MAG TPA: diiron oxygenase [Pseudonocardiaceae bacterium]
MSRAVQVAQGADRERTAERLLKSSAAKFYDPDVDVDWSAEPVPGMYYQPEHRLSLYGTPLWEQLSAEQRVELSRHEAASVASNGIWFEVILMRMLLKEVYQGDPRSNHVQYALTEIADECRHSVMFGKMSEKLGCPAYGPGRKGLALGKFFRATANPVEIFAAALFVEEVLDALQREATKDDDLQPLVRDVMRIHVVEEARHMRYAAEELARQWETLRGSRRFVSSVRLAIACMTAAERLVHPRAYGAVGLDITEAKAAARANPHWQATLAFASREVMADFEELGLLDVAPARWIYRRAGLWPTD